MNEKIDSQKFINQAEEIYQKALDATIELLKNSSKRQYVVCPDLVDEVDTWSGDEVPIAIWGVGLNDEGHICIKAFVLDAGYGFSEEDFPEEWIDITKEEIHKTSYPEIYRFVADNIDSAIDWTSAEEIELE